MKDILLIESFYGGSHGQLVQLMTEDKSIGDRCDVYILPAKKWHWRARTSALYFSQIIKECSSYRFLFTSSVLNLAELVALRPDLSTLKKIVYFHENQLVYPVRKKQDRDFQYGYNQILTSMVADVVVFNSKFNMDSFLTSISSHLKLIPDHRPKNIDLLIKHKCKVIYFPITFQPSNAFKEKQPDSLKTMSAEDDREKTEVHCQTEEAAPLPSSSTSSLEETQQSQDEQGHKKRRICATVKAPEAEINKDLMSGSSDCLHIVWPHRWEHDKDPDSFFDALFQLAEEGHKFLVSVMGESFTEVPEIFKTAREKLEGKVVAWGFQNKQDYYTVLDAGHVVVSTAQHEFFGVSVLEGVSRGCYPLCPKRLVYPEIYPDECLYGTQNQLVKKLRRFCQHPPYLSKEKFKDLVEQFSWETLQVRYLELFEAV